MSMKLKAKILLIRNFNRFYTNVLGPIDQRVLKSEFSLSEAWVLHEIGKTEGRTSKMLSDTLHVDVDCLNRIAWKFGKCGSIQEEQSTIDGRTYDLYITDTGRGRMVQLNSTPSSQIVCLLKPLPEIDCGFLTARTTAIETFLTEGRDADLQDIAIYTKIRPGNIGYTTYLHGYIYQEEYGYSAAFEHYTTDSFIQFISQYQPGNSRLRYAERHGNIIGYVSIAGHSGRTQLRQSLIDPHYRGLGLGKRLLREAIAFSRGAGYQTLFLDMTSDLDTAIATCQRAGFKRCDKKLNDT